LPPSSWASLTSGACQESIDGSASYGRRPYVLDGSGAASKRRPQRILEGPSFREAEHQAGAKAVSGANPGLLGHGNDWRMDDLICRCHDRSTGTQGERDNLGGTGLDQTLGLHRLAGEVTHFVTDDCFELG
jgi:hypothetical protein